MFNQKSYKMLGTFAKITAFYETLTSPRMEKLSKMHKYFGSNVFFNGPQCIPDDIVWADHPKDF
ncbi:MAG: hypothetical protein CMH07_08620 [Marinovum sp.]|nr:hypothetical protein [Marinovum sp.]